MSQFKLMDKYSLIQGESMHNIGKLITDIKVSTEETVSLN